MTQWMFDDDYRIWELRIGDTMVWIEQRPRYCDRGHFVGNVSGVRYIDGADGFPRYFMDLERAKLEMADWLAWRLQSEAARQ